MIIRTIKNTVLGLGVILFIGSLSAQTYTPSDNGSSVKFSIKNFALNVGGSFKGLKGKLTFNPASLSASSFNVSVDAATVNTGNGSRDNHLRKEEYLDAGKFPLISFASTKITPSGEAGNFMMNGKITIKGVTRNISFPFTATLKSDGYLFNGSFKLNRRDFGVGGSSMVMSDNLTVILSVLAKK